MCGVILYIATFLQPRSTFLVDYTVLILIRIHAVFLQVVGPSHLRVFWRHLLEPSCTRSIWRLVRLHLPRLCSANQGRTDGCVIDRSLIALLPDVQCDFHSGVLWVGETPDNFVSALFCQSRELQQLRYVCSAWSHVPILHWQTDLPVWCACSPTHVACLSITSRSPLYPFYQTLALIFQLHLVHGST